MFEGKKILFLGAHPDDIEFGCGGLLWRLRKENIRLHTFTNAQNYLGNQNLINEYKASMQFYGLEKVAVLEDFTNMSMWDEYTEVRQKLFDIKQRFNPDIVLCHNPKSLNQDHSCLGYGVLAVFQEQTILFYEDIRGGQFHLPNYYISLSGEEVEAKIEAIEKYTTQTHRKYFDVQYIRSLMLFRGLQIYAKYAESFEVSRIVNI
jgi:N-acetylglucosamine malate deacetylase 1